MKATFTRDEIRQIRKAALQDDLEQLEFRRGSAQDSLDAPVGEYMNEIESIDGYFRVYGGRCGQDHHLLYFTALGRRWLAVVFLGRMAGLEAMLVHPLDDLAAGRIEENGTGRRLWGEARLLVRALEYANLYGLEDLVGPREERQSRVEDDEGDDT